MKNSHEGTKTRRNEQGGASRPEYGSGLLKKLAAALNAEFGKGFDASNLRYMRLFYQAFPNCDALRHNLSWTHYRLLLRVENALARHYQKKSSSASRMSFSPSRLRAFA
jgi:hypothetical protein